MSCIAIIPARGGSRRIPRKNIRMFHGKPIIAYSIETARASGLFDMIVVTTDDEQIAQIARDFGANVISRPAQYAEDNVGTQEVVRQALHAIEDGKLDSMTFRMPFAYVCCIYATAPMMTIGDLRRGYLMLRDLSGVAHAISVGYPPLQDAAQFYWSKAEALRENIEYFDWSTVPVRVAPERVCDINTIEDWQRAEQMYAALQEREK